MKNTITNYIKGCACYVATERQPERRLLSWDATRLSDNRHELLKSRAMMGHKVVADTWT